MLEKEDYEEPCCPFKLPKENAPRAVICVSRIMEKNDAFLAKNDYDGSKKLLCYWLNEAKSLNDKKGMLSMENELMGLFRKLNQKEEALFYAKDALKLCEELQYENALSAATTYINSGTVFKAFEKAEAALPLFEKAKAIYEEKLDASDSRLAGLYNNMALLLTDLSQFEEAEHLFEKALSVLCKNKNSYPEQAITWLNIASNLEKQFGLVQADEAISDAIARARELLYMPQPFDGNYAYVCEKCAKVLDYYGYFLDEEELMERANKIYAMS